MSSPPARLLLALIVVVSALPITATPLGAQPGPPFPVHFPQDPEVTTFHNSWGAARSGGRKHIGNDLMAPKMTEVYSIADGVVLKVASSARAGRYLIIGHAEGWESYYIHLNNDTPGTDDGKAGWALTVAPGIFVGSEVAGGQLIGWVGDSGNAEWTMPHTHFELHRDGRPVNPYHILVLALERYRQRVATPMPGPEARALYID